MLIKNVPLPSSLRAYEAFRGHPYIDTDRK